MSPVPTCPRCNSSASVRRGVGSTQSYSWLCCACLQKLRDLDLAVSTWRLWLEVDRITREAA